MLTLLLIGIWLLTMAWTMSAGIAYWRQVLPTLERRGYKPYWPVGTPSGQWRQIEEYGRICREEGLPLHWYRLLRWLWFVGPALIVAFVVVGLLIDGG